MRKTFFAYVLIEAIGFLLLGAWIGFGKAFLLITGLFILGLVLAAWQMRALASRAMRSVREPGKLTADAALSAFGAFLVALPGVVTTVIGILFLLPPTRTLIRRSMGSALQAKIIRMGGTTFTTASRASDPRVQDIPGWGEVIDHRSDEFDPGTGPTSPDFPGEGDLGGPYSGTGR